MEERLLTVSLTTGLTLSTASVLTLVLAALLALRTGVVTTGEGAGPGVVGVIVTALPPAHHLLLHPGQEEVQGGGLLDGSGLVERSSPDTVVDRSSGRVGGWPVKVDDVTGLVVQGQAGGLLLQCRYVGPHEPHVDLSLGSVLGHIQQISEISHEYSLEDVGVKITGVISVAGLQENSSLGHPPASNQVSTSWFSCSGLTSTQP